jgi:hypothetical protein
VEQGTNIERSLVDFTVSVEFLTVKVILPLTDDAGTLTTSWVADWLTKEVTALFTTVKRTELTRSRFVPVMVTLASGATGLETYWL